VVKTLNTFMWLWAPLSLTVLTDLLLASTSVYRIENNAESRLNEIFFVPTSTVSVQENHLRPSAATVYYARGMTGAQLMAIKRWGTISYVSEILEMLSEGNPPIRMGTTLV